MKAFIGLVMAAILASAWGCEASSPTQTASQAALQARAIETLQTALAEQDAFVKVHAAEALLTLSYGNKVADVFQRELELHGTVPQYRTAIWRCWRNPRMTRRNQHPSFNYFAKLR